MYIEKEALLQQLRRWQAQELGTARALLEEVIELVEQQPEKEEEPCVLRRASDDCTGNFGHAGEHLPH